MATAVSVDQLCINTIRTLAIDAVQKANSGHPGLPLGAAPMAYVLWQRHLKHNPRDPLWADRDRFVLSAGHGCMLLYCLLHLSGYDLSLQDLEDFRQWDSKTPGHPESFMTPGVEAVTGPLGQGTANLVGMAMAERALAHRFNKGDYQIVDHMTYGLISDGDVMEGVAIEAAALAGHLKLGKLVCLYDANDVTLDGPASLSFSEDIGKRYAAQGWQILEVRDGDHDLEGLDSAMTEAKADTGRPSLVIVKTTIGYGSPNKQGKASSHGSPLGEDEIVLTKKALGWDPDARFYVPEDVRSHFREAIDRGVALQSTWQSQFEAYRAEHPALAEEWERRFQGRLPDGWEEVVPEFKASEKLATREASGKVLNAIAKRVPELIGGDADLSGSTKTAIENGDSFDGQTGAGRNIHFGVREHAMGSVMNGVAYHGGLRGYSATFFCFSDYMRPSIRLAALAALPHVFVWTHDSIGLGEDGPTHQPVEQLMSLRLMPNLHVMRPADSNETAEAWRWAMERTEGPTALVLSRQKWETFDRANMAPASELRKGAYILSEAKASEPRVVLLATGSEVPLALDAQSELEGQGIACRVVSMPCWELFAEQTDAYRGDVLLGDSVIRVSIEAGVTLGWQAFVGQSGASIGIDRFGASAPASTNFAKFGFTTEHVVEVVKERI